MLEKQKIKIRQFYKKHHRLPSYREMMTLFNWRSKNAVWRLVKKLIEDGFMAKDAQGKLVPQQIFGQTKLLGLVEAGFPSPAEEELADTITLDEYLIKNKEATFMLKVAGDSMIGAGILDGDMVLVERHLVPKDGDIVVAEVDHQWTMKYFRKKGRRIYLEAANKKYKAIYPEEELKIAAVVKAVVRKY